MAMGTTLPCGDRTRDRLEELRGDDFQSWDAFLNFLADEHERCESGGATDSDLAVMQDSLEIVEERTGRIERQLEELEGRR